MKKIMFNDRYGLTEAVLNGRKTVTRRLVSYDKDGNEKESIYKVGDIVAIAQSYKNAGYKEDKIIYRSVPKVDGYLIEEVNTLAGWNNKMFVAANLMPHTIKITGVRKERLRDICNYEIECEGILHVIDNGERWYNGIDPNGYGNIRDAFSALINKICGAGTWESDPLVWVYDFELIKNNEITR